MEDEKYEKRLEYLQKYLPSLTTAISGLKKDVHLHSAKTRAKFYNLKDLYSILTRSGKKCKLENLQRIEEVLRKIEKNVEKMNKPTNGIASPEPFQGDDFNYNFEPVEIPTERVISVENDVVAETNIFERRTKTNNNSNTRKTSSDVFSRLGDKIDTVKSYETLVINVPNEKACNNNAKPATPIKMPDKPKSAPLSLEDLNHMFDDNSNEAFFTRRPVKPETKPKVAPVAVVSPPAAATDFDIVRMKFAKYAIKNKISDTISDRPATPLTTRIKIETPAQQTYQSGDLSPTASISSNLSASSRLSANASFVPMSPNINDPRLNKATATISPVVPMKKYGTSTYEHVAGSPYLNDSILKSPISPPSSINTLHSNYNTDPRIQKSALLCNKDREYPQRYGGYMQNSASTYGQQQRHPDMRYADMSHQMEQRAHLSMNSYDRYQTATIPVIQQQRATTSTAGIYERLVAPHHKSAHQSEQRPITVTNQHDRHQHAATTTGRATNTPWHRAATPTREQKRSETQHWHAKAQQHSAITPVRLHRPPTPGPTNSHSKVATDNTKSSTATTSNTIDINDDSEENWDSDDNEPQLSSSSNKNQTAPSTVNHQSSTMEKKAKTSRVDEIEANLNDAYHSQTTKMNNTASKDAQTTQQKQQARKTNTAPSTFSTNSWHRNAETNKNSMKTNFPTAVNYRQYKQQKQAMEASLKSKANAAVMPINKADVPQVPLELSNNKANVSALDKLYRSGSNFDAKSFSMTQISFKIPKKQTAVAEATKPPAEPTTKSTKTDKDAKKTKDVTDISKNEIKKPKEQTQVSENNVKKPTKVVPLVSDKDEKKAKNMNENQDKQESSSKKRESSKTDDKKSQQEAHTNVKPQQYMSVKNEPAQTVVAKEQQPQQEQKVETNKSVVKKEQEQEVNKQFNEIAKNQQESHTLEIMTLDKNLDFVRNRARILKRRQTMVERPSAPEFDKSNCGPFKAKLYEDAIAERKEKEKQENKFRKSRALADMFEKTDDNCTVSTQNIIEGKRTRGAVNTYNEVQQTKAVFHHIKSPTTMKKPKGKPGPKPKVMKIKPGRKPKETNEVELKKLPATKKNAIKQEEKSEEGDKHQNDVNKVLSLLSQILPKDKLEVVTKVIQDDVTIVEPLAANSETACTSNSRKQAAASSSSSNKEKQLNVPKITKTAKQKNMPEETNIRQQVQQDGSNKPRRRLNELDKLNEDIRNMFIRDQVLAAMGRRAAALVNEQGHKRKSNQNYQADELPLKKKKFSKAGPLCSKRQREESDDEDIAEIVSETSQKEQHVPEMFRRKLKVKIVKMKLPVFETVATQEVHTAITDKLISTPVTTDSAASIALDSDHSTVNVASTAPFVEMPAKKRQKLNSGCTLKISKNDFGKPPKNDNADWHSQSVHVKTCIACRYSSPYLANHYRMEHYENYTSRLSPALLEKFKNNQLNRCYFSWRHPKNGIYNFFQCGFCLQFLKTPTQNVLEHFSIHTSEYRFECSTCRYNNHRAARIEAHITERCKTGTVVRREFPKESGKIYGHVCHLCNYVQMSRKHLNEHYVQQHDYVAGDETIAQMGYCITLLHIDNAIKVTTEEEMLELEACIKRTHTFDVNGMHPAANAIGSSNNMEASTLDVALNPPYPNVILKRVQINNISKQIMEQPQHENSNCSMGSAEMDLDTSIANNEQVQTASKVIDDDDDSWEDIEECQEEKPNKKTKTALNYRLIKKTRMPAKITLPKRPIKALQQQKQTTLAISSSTTTATTTETTAEVMSTTDSEMAFRPMIANLANLDDLLPACVDQSSLDLAQDLPTLHELNDFNAYLQVDNVPDLMTSSPHSSIEDAIDLLCEEEQRMEEQQEQEQLQTADAGNKSPIIQKKLIDNIGYELNPKQLEQCKFYCLQVGCSFIFSSEAIGLEAHFQQEHAAAYWTGYCNTCQRQVQIIEGFVNQFTVAQEIQHMLKCHIEVAMAVHEATVAAEQQNQNANKPRITLRRLSGDCLSSNSNTNSNSLTSVEANISGKDTAEIILNDYLLMQPQPMLNANNTINSNNNICSKGFLGSEGLQNMKLKDLLDAKPRPPTKPISSLNVANVTAEPLFTNNQNNMGLAITSAYSNLPASVTASAVATTTISCGLEHLNSNKTTTNTHVVEKSPQITSVCSLNARAPKEQWTEIRQVDSSGSTSLFAPRPSASPEPILVSETVPTAQMKDGDFVITQMVDTQYQDNNEHPQVQFNINIAAIPATVANTNSISNIMKSSDILNKQITQTAADAVVASPNNISNNTMKTSDILNKKITQTAAAAAAAAAYAECAPTNSVTASTTAATVRVINPTLPPAKFTQQFSVRNSNAAAAAPAIETDTAIPTSTNESGQQQNIHSFICLDRNCKFISSSSSVIQSHLHCHERKADAKDIEYLRCSFCSYVASNAKQCLEHYEQLHAKSAASVAKSCDLTRKINQIIKSKDVTIRTMLSNNITSTNAEKDIEYENELRLAIENYLKVRCVVPDDKLYQCLVKDCKSRLTADTFHSHVTYHLTTTGSKSRLQDLPCVHCTMKFSGTNYLKQHLLAAHKQHSYFCYICLKNSYDVSQLSNHYRQRHLTTASPTTKVLVAKSPGSTAQHYYVLVDGNSTNIDLRQFGDRLIQIWKRKKHINKRKLYKPDEVSLLPVKPIFDEELHCAVCLYKTKVRINLIRHLQMHNHAQQTSDSDYMPQLSYVDPVNPVPCLQSNEKHFDKMTNLASSSLVPKAGNTGVGVSGSGSTANKSNKKITMSTETMKLFKSKYKFVVERERFRCNVSDCIYQTQTENGLRAHINTLHKDVEIYKCQFCEKPIDRVGALGDCIIEHLRFHSERIYQCRQCDFVHYERGTIEQHTVATHGGKEWMCHKRSIKGGTTSNQQIKVTNSKKSTAALPTASIVQKSDSSTNAVNAVSKGKFKFICEICKFKAMTLPQMQTHIFSHDGLKHLFRCAYCNFNAEKIPQVHKHIELTHMYVPREVVQVYRRLLRNEETNGEDEIAAPTQALAVDTTPLWLRDDPKRVRHIRGILMENEEEAALHQQNLLLDYDEDEDSNNIIIELSEDPLHS